jgi:hypothetical protein
VRGPRPWYYWAGLTGALLAGGIAAWLLLSPAEPLPGTPLVSVPPHQPAPESPAPNIEIPFQTASIPQIEARRGTTPALFRLQEDPAVLVLDFPGLHVQAQMLNRVAALIEKADMPRDRVVAEAELDAHIRATGGDPDAYYYGHDYRAADLARFFRLAADQNIPLNPSEIWLRDRLARFGWLQQAAVGALISIPGVGAGIDATSRTTIFRHELSHAVYFTDPAYVALTQHLWTGMLTEQERDAIRAFLGKDGYDTKDEDLMANEGQAYLIHTRDPRYFMPAMVGIDAVRETILRGTFIDAIPEPWLRESALAVAPVVPTTQPPTTEPPATEPPAPPPAIEPPATPPAAVTTEPSSEPERPPPHAPLSAEAPPEPNPTHQ